MQGVGQIGDDRVSAYITYPDRVLIVLIRRISTMRESEPSSGSTGRWAAVIIIIVVVVVAALLLM